MTNIIKHKYHQKFFDKVDKVTLFWYIVIVIIIITIFSKMIVEINILIGIIVAFGMISILYYNYSVDQMNSDELFEQKKKLIYPQPTELLLHNEMVDFLFSIQEFYSYNPQAYEDMIEQIDIFFKLYNEVHNNNDLASIDYELMTDHMNSAINSLQSLVFKMTPDVKRDQKLKNAVLTLRKICETYLNEVYLIYQERLYEVGYTTNTKLITKLNIGYDTTFIDPYYSTYSLA